MFELVLRVPQARVEPLSDALVDELGALAVSVEDADAGTGAEHALFGEASQELTGPEGARRCQYLASIGDLALDAATAVTEAWRSGGGRQEFLAADGSDPEDALPQLLNSVTHAVKAVDEKGLRDMAAAETYQDLPDTRIDGPGAFGIGRRKARLDGAVAVIGEGDGGLVAIVASRSPETAQRLETAAR